MSNENISVSIICLAYNHEAFIKDCLEGFIIQETNFKFEILIHDDASTDNTVAIIREYEKRYPELIKPIYQTVNQYSKGVKIAKSYLFPLVKGKYIACCEGDDCWTDKNKLQRQFDFLESHPDFSVCVHQAILHSFKSGNDSFVTPCDVEKDFSFQEVVLGGGGLFATSSYFVKKDVYLDRPDCFNAKGFGDYQTIIFGAILGKVHYFKESMSIYNYATPGSWTSRVFGDNSKRMYHMSELIHMLMEVNVYYNYKYDEVFSKMILQTEYRMKIQSGSIISIHRKKYRDFYLNDIREGKHPDKNCIANRYPYLYRAYSSIRRRVNE